MNSRGSTLAVRRRYSRAFLCRAFPVPLHLCTACCLVPPARTNGAKYLRRLEPQACCARPSGGPHCGLTEIGLCCYASITHTFVEHRLVSRASTYCFATMHQMSAREGTLALPGRRSVAAQTRSQSALRASIA